MTHLFPSTLPSTTYLRLVTLSMRIYQVGYALVVFTTITVTTVMTITTPSATLLSIRQEVDKDVEVW